VQVELSLWQDTNVLNRVVQYCLTHGLQLIAYRPLGGARHAPRVSSDPVLAEVAARHGATAHEIALAWLEDVADAIVAVPGPTRLETVQSISDTLVLMPPN
jgi:2,5-diketo-D-gluconate reductase B